MKDEMKNFDNELPVKSDDTVLEQNLILSPLTRRMYLIHKDGLFPPPPLSILERLIFI